MCGQRSKQVKVGCTGGGVGKGASTLRLFVLGGWATEQAG